MPTHYISEDLCREDILNGQLNNESVLILYSADIDAFNKEKALGPSLNTVKHKTQILSKCFTKLSNIVKHGLHVWQLLPGSAL